MIKKNIGIFALFFSIFILFAFSKNASAAVPSSVIDQLTDACRGGWIMEKNFDGSESKFEKYSGTNNFITTNWISSDWAGNNVINSVYNKNDFKISKENRTFYFNIAGVSCLNQTKSGSATNVRIQNGVGDSWMLEGGAVFGYAGQGSVHNFSLGPGQIGRIGVFEVKIKESEIEKLQDGKIISFDVNQCAAGYPGSNYSAGLDVVQIPAIAPGFCYRFTAQVKVKAPVKFKVKKSTKAAVLNSNQWLNSNDSRFKTNGRRNPQTAKVGQWVSFNHKVTAKDFNRGNVSGRATYNTTHDIGSGYQTTTNYRGEFSWYRGWQGQLDIINQGKISDSVNATNPENEVIRITREMAGKTICSRMNFKIWAGDIDNVNRYQSVTDEACVYVPYEFDITPCVRIDKIRNCSGGDLDIPVDGKIPPDPNDGEEIRIPEDGTVTSKIRYKVTTWRVSADKENFLTRNNKRDNENGDTCAASNYYYQDYQGVQNCRVVREDNSGKSYSRDVKVADYIPEIEDGVEAGTRYCVALSISPYKMTANQTREQQAQNTRQWRHSAPICIKVVKKPKVQFWGNGVYSKGGIRTSLSSTKQGLFGSWVEYEALSAVKIRDFRTESSQNTRRLAIEDYTSTGIFGQGRSSIDSIIASISAKFPRRNIDNTNLSVEVLNGDNETLRAGITADKQTRVIYGKNIQIANNIVNADRIVNRDSDFRQIIIIADGDITINQNVTRVDAWLIARGTINTCVVNGAQNANNVNTQNCDNQLRIRGGTISDSLKLWRTAGSYGKTRDKLTSPAEIFNQSADTYLWAQTQSGGEGKIVTTYTKELPVRY